MITFKIEVQEFLARVVEVQAKNKSDAFLKVNEIYKKAEIVLNYNDFVEVNFIDINTQSKTDETKNLMKEVVEYLYSVEKRHYEESDRPKDHIFKRLKKLKKIID